MAGKGGRMTEVHKCVSWTWLEAGVPGRWLDWEMLRIEAICISVCLLLACDWEKGIEGRIRRVGMGLDPGSLIAGCVPLGEPQNLSEPQVPNLRTGSGCCPHRLLWGEMKQRR